MFTASDDVVTYLLSRGLITPTMAVDGDIAVLDVSRRNSNFKVLNDAGGHLFLKQETRAPVEGASELPVHGSVAYEAAIHELLAVLHPEGALRDCLPRYHDFDRDEQLLVLEGFAGWTTLGDHYLRRGRMSRSHAAMLGTVLARLHRVSSSDRALIARRIGAPKAPPWVFSLPEPEPWVYTHSSASNLELIGILQRSDELCRTLEGLRSQWSDDGFIHGDLKWDNCLVPGKRARGELRIVDWELARLGDPCWDVGTVFSGFLDAWLSSIPISGDHPPDEFIGLARFPLETMQPALRAFWSAYSRGVQMPPADGTASLEKATSFAGVRLVQTAFELQQIETGLNNRAVYLLQLCSNIVDRPLEAATHLLGLELPALRYA